MPMTREEKLAEIARIDRQIAEATGWGAWLGAIAERRDALAASVGLPAIRKVGGVPLRD